MPATKELLAFLSQRKTTHERSCRCWMLPRFVAHYSPANRGLAAAMLYLCRLQEDVTEVVVDVG